MHPSAYLRNRALNTSAHYKTHFPPQDRPRLPASPNEIVLVRIGLGLLVR